MLAIEKRVAAADAAQAGFVASAADSFARPDIALLRQAVPRGNKLDKVGAFGKASEAQRSNTAIAVHSVNRNPPPHGHNPPRAV